MATQKTHDLVIKVGEYTNSQGQTKARTKNVGSVMRREDGSTFLAIDASIIAMETQWVCNPDHKSQVFVSVYPAGERDEQAPRRATPAKEAPAAAKRGDEDFSDDIPF